MKSVKSIQIQTIDYCDRKCPWCPNSKMEKKQSSLMPFVVLDRILSELKRLDYKGDFHPFLMAEPLCDWRIVNIVKEIRQRFPNNHVRINTNGDMLKDATDVSLLLDSGVDAIHVSHYDEDIGVCKDMVFGERVVHVGMDAMKPTFFNRAGNVDVPDAKKHEICTYVFEKMCFTVKGDVILCCSDYNHEIIFGNVLKTPLDVIRNTEKYKHFRETHKKARGKDLPLCDRCNRI